MNMDPGSWSARVAAVIRDDMACQHLSVEALAHLLGVPDTTTAGHLLAGAAPFDLVEVELVAAWLGVSPSELLARAD